MKRFIDTELPDKKWFYDLSLKERYLFVYLTLKCDNVGVWSVNKSLAESYVGEKVNWDQFLEKVSSQITILSNEKWWLKDFCEFQYGKLTEHSKPHTSYIKLLKKHGLLDRIEVVSKKGFQRV